MQQKEEKNPIFFFRNIFFQNFFWIFFWILLDFFGFFLLSIYYSIVKDSSADLGVNSKIVQIRPSQGCQHQNFKKNFLHICQYFDISERK